MHNDIHRIRDALRCIPVGGHDERVRIAFMLKQGLGEAGRDLWDEWRGDRGNDEAASVWKSASEDGSLKIATLFHDAKANGWRGDGCYKRPTQEELSERKRIAAEQAAKEEAEIARERADTAAKAAAILKAATKARPDHPYLQRKRVPTADTLREIDARKAAAILGYVPKSRGEPLAGRLLVVPVKQGDGISTLELIDGDTRKAALAGRGSKAGGYWATERLPEGSGDGLTLQIGEGVATVLSAKEATGHPAIAALSSGNLLAVAKAIRGRYPSAELVILADLVKATGEPDHHASEAARTVGGKVAIPDFGDEREPDAKDFNDMAAICGSEAVKRAIANASKQVGGEPQPTAGNAQAGDCGGWQESQPLSRKIELTDQVVAKQANADGVLLVKGSDLKPEPVRWLWRDWLALGKLHLLAGAPGHGKTTLVLALAATVTCGGRFPDGSRCDSANVLIWSGEDDPTDTLLPRLLAMGADTSRVFFIKAARIDGEVLPFDPARDLAALAAEAERIGEVRLLMVDPVVSAVTGDSHKNTEVRRALQPIVDLAAAIGAAAVGISHFGKGSAGRDPVERVVGSVAFAAVARVVLVAAKHREEDGGERRIIARAKSNIGPDEGGFVYSIEQVELDAYPGVMASRVMWGEAVEGRAQELLAQAEDDDQDNDHGDVAEWLRDLLKNGPVAAKAVLTDATGAGYSRDQAQRAARRIGVVRRKVGMDGGWVWSLPEGGDEGGEGGKFGKVPSSMPSVPSSTNRAPVTPIAPVSESGVNGANGGVNDDVGVI